LRTTLGFNSSSRTRIAKGNAGIPKYVDGHIHYDGTPELMAEYVRLAHASGARIIGGCCGTTPEHLRAMREALDTIETRPAPTLDEISTALGGFSSEKDGTEEGQSEARPARRRRRQSA